MLTSLKKYSPLVSLLTVLFLLVVSWFYPSPGLALGTILLFLALTRACLAVLRKHRQSWLEGEIPYYVFLRNVTLEVSGILLAMACAAFLGNHIAQMATRSIDHVLVRFAAGVCIGLLAGLLIGLAIQNVWGRLVRPARPASALAGEPDRLATHGGD